MRMEENQSFRRQEEEEGGRQAVTNGQHKEKDFSKPRSALLQGGI